MSTFKSVLEMLFVGLCALMVMLLGTLGGALLAVLSTFLTICGLILMVGSLLRLILLDIWLYATGQQKKPPPT